jgi:hypothetical protein
MNVADGMWYSILIVSEVFIILCRIGNDIIERANKNYKQYKPDNKFTGYTA